MRRVLALLLAAALALGGCAALTEPEEPVEDWESYQPLLPEEQLPEEPEEPDYPAAFSIPYYRDRTMDPVTCAEGVQETAASLLYEPLFRLDEAFQPVPLLCESWQWDETGLICTLTLREGVLFSDGSALTARDAAETLQRAMTSERYAYRLRNMAEAAANRKGELVITLTSPNRGLPALLDIPIVKRTTAGQQVPVGTGPYQLVEEDGQAYLQARSDWWQGTALPAEVLPLVHAKDWDTAKYLFTARRVELLAADPTDDPTLVSGQAQAVSQPTAIMQFIGFNAAPDRLFSDAALRALFSQGIDRETLVNAQLAKLAQAAQFPVSPLSSLYPKELETAYSQEKTLSALRDANQDTGERKELTMLVSQGNAFRSASARFIAEGLSLLDWRVTVTELPWEEYLAALEAGEFDLYFGEVRLTADWDLTDLTGTDGPLNYGGYSNQVTDTLLELYLASDRQPETAGRLYSHLRSAAPIAPVCFKNYAVLTHPDVAEGLSPAPSCVFYKMENWRIHLAAEDDS